MPAAAPPSDTAADGPRGWLVALLFWLCLILAAAMYAAVSLSPKLLAWIELRDEHYAHQVRLVEVERQVSYLGRVVDALENDPEFAAQLARVDFDAARPGDERITVDPSLSLDAHSETPPRSLSPRSHSWSVPLLRQFTDRPDLRRALLTIAAALCVFAFTFLQESLVSEALPSRLISVPVAESKQAVRWSDWLTRRYRKSPLQ